MTDSNNDAQIRYWKSGPGNNCQASYSGHILDPVN